MRYESWLNYPEMSIAIQKVDKEYRCTEYDTYGNSLRNTKTCSGTLELKFYLLSLPSPPKKQILGLITTLSEAEETKAKTNSNY